TYTGLHEIEVEEIKQLFPKDSTSTTFYFEDYMADNIDVAQTEANVWKASRLPGLIVGYGRNTDFETNFRYRFKAGITIPIWQSQYTGAINAARAEAEMLEMERDLKLREAKLQRLTWDRKLTQAEIAIGDYQLIGKPRIDELKSIYDRLFEAGETDFIQTLRNIADLSSIYPAHLEMVKLYNQSVIELDFLNGQN
ncbi:MAG TPA: TolC family protein, partial [Saprospiraceae bacterium]|nr:TolC family protein [Saprospiraceae bacterium]